MTNQNLSEGVVHETTDGQERAPERPPSGPIVWINENLISGATPLIKVLNGILSFVFALLALNILQFLTSYMFSADRRWSAVTYNMKLLMVQAFPQEQLFRIWLSIGIFFVLVAWSLVAWGLSGRMSFWSLTRGLRSTGVLLVLVAIMHHAHDAPRVVNIATFKIDTLAAWSTTRYVICGFGLALFFGAFYYIRRVGTDAKEQSVPFLAVIATGMMLIAALIWTIDLPVAVSQFDQAQQPIARTTTGPWTILFLVVTGAYFIGKLLIRKVSAVKCRKILVILWLISYPVIIMIIQRSPILDWTNLLGFGDTPFQQSALGLLLIFGILGGLITYWLALPSDLIFGRLIAGLLAVAMAGAGWRLGASTLVSVIGTVFGLLLLIGAVVISDRLELARFVGAGLVVISLLVIATPMPFVVRILIAALALTAVAAPSFGGTAAARRKLVIIWAITALVVIIAFVLGDADTALQFGGTTFLGGFNLTILLGISGVALSFPVGVILALARTSTMPIFRLLATVYIELVRSVPLITWLFFGSVMLAIFLPSGVEFDEIVRIVAALTIFSAAYVAETVRGGLQAIDKGQYEASRAMGLTVGQSISLIVLPQAVRAVIPALVGSIIVAFKDTSLVAIIGLADILLIARTFVPGQSNPNFQGTQAQMLFFVAIFYWIFTFTFSRLSLRYEKSLGLGQR